VVPLKQKFTGQELATLLNDLGATLLRNGVTAEIMIYGGAVMCMEYGARASTTDIDYTYDNQYVSRYADEVGKHYGLDKGWINSAVQDIVRGDMIHREVAKTLYFGALTINIPTPQQMLAMKLYAARMGEDFVDLQDAIFLARHLGITKRIELDGVLKTYFSLDAVRKRNKRYSNVIGRFMGEVEKLLCQGYTP
jgi:hypothetical protein